jgi:hypothetical protein
MSALRDAMCVDHGASYLRHGVSIEVRYRPAGMDMAGGWHFSVDAGIDEQWSGTADNFGEAWEAALARAADIIERTTASPVSR